MVNKICGVYGIFDSYTEDCLYIGQSRDIEARKKSHMKGLKYGTHKRKDFSEWYKNKGFESTSILFAILEECEPVDSELNSVEIKWFNHHAPRYFGAVPSMNNTWEQSEATKLKISGSLSESIQISRGPDYIPRIKRDLVCKGCGKVFHSTRKSQEFCESICLIQFNRESKETLTRNVCASYLNGHSLRSCGKIHGISYGTVLKMLVENNIARRSR